MEVEIGNAAGMIWRHLDQNGETTLGKLQQGTKLSEPLLLMGLGWLAREGKLALAKSPRGLRVALRGEQAGPGHFV